MNELNVFCFVTNLVITVFIGALLPIIPMLTRKSFLFGVRIPPEENGGTEAKLLKKRYTTVCLMGSLAILAAVIVQFMVAPDLTVLGVMYFPLLFVAVQLLAFVPQHKSALLLKHDKKWQVSTSVFAETKSSFTRGKLSSMPHAWYAAGLLIIIISTALVFARYPEMPERMATHYGFDMQPDAWADKSVGRVLLMPIINLASLALLWATGAIVEKSKLQIDAYNAELSFAQHRIYRRRMGHSVGFLAIGIVLTFVLIDLPNIIDGFHMSFWAIITLSMIPTALLCFVSISSGQGGCKIKINVEALDKKTAPDNTRRAAANDRSDDRLWAFGMFYHNPDDPAVFVEDRFGGNLGLNYSRTSAKIGVAALLLMIVGVYVWFTVWWVTI